MVNKKNAVVVGLEGVDLPVGDPSLDQKEHTPVGGCGASCSTPTMGCHRARRVVKGMVVLV